MKNLTILFLALGICLSLCACGGTPVPQSETTTEATVAQTTTTAQPALSEEELVATTPMLDLEKMWFDIDDNQAKAMQTYNKKMYQVKVTVLNIGTGHFDYAYKFADGVTKSIKVFMPTETLATLKNNDRITVLGELILSGSLVTLQNAFVVDSSNVEVKTFDDQEIQEAIDNYNCKKGGKIDWTVGSGPFFVDNRLSFEQLDADTFLSHMEGEWIGKEYSTADKTTRYITFTNTGTADVTEDHETVYSWKYSFSGDMIKFPEAASQSYEIRKVSDRLIVFYAKTVDYVPYWILYKN